MTTVSELLARLKGLGVSPQGVADDSRQVQPGDLFLAYPGDLADGRRFIDDALRRGAEAVLWQPGGEFAWSSQWSVANLPVESLRPLAGPLAHEIYGQPSEKMSVVAITGTNGKTTISQCLARAYPQPSTVIGTLGAGFPDKLEETGFTTPEATTLMRYLAAFRAQGAAACMLEASSIGIEEGRMNGLQVDVAVFSNFTRDHLDYHATMEAYAAAKEKLFCWPGLRTAIVNLDDPLGQKIYRESTARHVFGYAIADDREDVAAEIRAERLRATANGQRFVLALPNGSAEVETTLVGRYNIHNLLAVAGVLFDKGLSAEEIALRTSALTPPPGRMERLGGEGEPLVVVDYAHTPDALENALCALREVARARGGRLSVVFGCGGDRDRGKRPLMGLVAEQHADRVVVTSDNPRREKPQEIIAEIVAGMREPLVVEERAAAIRQAIVEAATTDVVLLAGKGHESYQEVAGVRYPFSDIGQAQAALRLRHVMEKA